MVTPTPLDEHIVVYRLKNTKTGKFASGHSMYAEDTDIGNTYQTLGAAKVSAGWRRGQYQLRRAILVDNGPVKE